MNKRVTKDSSGPLKRPRSTRLAFGPAVNGLVVSHFLASKSPLRIGRRDKVRLICYRLPVMVDTAPFILYQLYPGTSSTRKITVPFIVHGRSGHGPELEFHGRWKLPEGSRQSILGGICSQQQRSATCDSQTCNFARGKMQQTVKTKLFGGQRYRENLYLKHVKCVTVEKLGHMDGWETWYHRYFVFIAQTQMKTTHWVLSRMLS